VDFNRNILPLLKASCFQCHGPARQEAGLRLDTRAALLKGGISGPAVIPGKSQQSRLVQRLRGLGGKARMPLGFAPISQEQIAQISAWIDQGAVWPEKPGAGARHWAYLKPIRRTPPKVKLKAWVRNPIDNFVLARLEKERLRPSPEAPKEALLRRVSLDLTRLPPTPQEIDSFLTDRSPNAYEKVVDRLLASPHFGERWARVWLDLARYADTHGYEKDARRSIWLYRDWVIWGGEFGRTPMNEERDGSKFLGRDHHPHAFSVWQAGGGIKGGTVVGSTDELGYNVAEDPVHVHDLHATLLYLMGLDHTRLTYKYQGRQFRLTDVSGQVIHKMLA